MEEAQSKFNVGSVRIPRLPEYIDPRGETPELVLPHPSTNYEIPVPEIPP